MEEPVVNALQYYYEKQEAVTREGLLALKSIILSVDENIVHKRKYRIPFFCYNEFNLGFLWVHKKTIIVGFIEDKKSFPPAEQRTKDSVTTLEVNPLDDIPVDQIEQAVRQLIKKYKYRPDKSPC